MRCETAVDVAVVGAGPAGLAAATRAGAHGATVALVDAGGPPGGQYWRQPEGTGSHDGPTTYRDLVATLEQHQRQGTTQHLSRRDVWALERDAGQSAGEGGFLVHVVDRTQQDARPETIRARRLVLATGAYDRQVPFPGWDLPGVMAAGGVQALLKGHGVLAGDRVVVAGTGPFLLPVAAGLAGAGASVVGVHEAGSPQAWLRHSAVVVRNLGKLGEGARYAATLARHRIPLRTGSQLVAAHGTDRLEAVTVRGVASGRETVVECDTLAVGWGFTPRMELVQALGCATRVDADGSLVAVVDDDQRSSVPGVYVAGEACGVGGAALAVTEGLVAGAAAAGATPPTRRERRRRAALRAFAAAIHDAHPVPSGWTSRVEPDTVVCRCEEVTGRELHHAIEHLGSSDARSAKLLTRAGMGWCQGRVCGYGVACLMAAWSDRPAPAVALGPGAIAAPLTLGQLAAGLEPDDASFLDPSGSSE